MAEIKDIIGATTGALGEVKDGNHSYGEKPDIVNNLSSQSSGNFSDKLQQLRSTLRYDNLKY